MSEETLSATLDPASEKSPTSDNVNRGTSLTPKGALKTTELSMGGVKVKVRTDATPAFLKQIRELVDTRFDQFSDTLARGVSAQQLMVLVAFNLAEDLLKERERSRLLKRRVVECSERLIERVESHLGKEK